MLQRGACVSLAFLLAGCALDSHAWYVSKYKDSAGFLFESEAKARDPEPAPDAKAVIGRDITAVFGHTEVKNVGVGPARPNGNGFIACVRADVAGITKADLGIQYFMVEIDRGKVGLRRPATPADRCETDKFEAI